jgi:hypothetical protein
MLVGSGFLYGSRYPAAIAGADWVGLVGYLVCLGYWIVRYVKGDPEGGNDPRVRKQIPAPTSAVLLLFPLAWVLISRTGAPGDPLSSDKGLAGWTAVLALATLSIVLRGHERKLHGSYAGQTRWLKHNKELYERIIDPTIPVRDASPANPVITTQVVDRSSDGVVASRPRSFLDRAYAAVRAWRG